MSEVSRRPVAKAKLILLVLGASIALSPPARASDPQADARDLRNTPVDGVSASDAARLRHMFGQGGLAPAATPEEEMARQRNLINRAHDDFEGMVGDARAPIGWESDGSASGRGREAVNPPLGGATGKVSPGKQHPGGEIGDASAGGRSGGADTATVGRIQGPPRAIAIEGRVIVQGGEGGAQTPGRQGMEIRYSIEERFVGNLVIAEAMEIPARDSTESPLGDASATGSRQTGEELSGTGRSGTWPLVDPGIAPGSGREGRSDMPGESSAGEASGSRADRGKPTVEASTGREYQIDTLSTSIQVRSVQGGVCLERGSREGACARSVPFSQHEVATSNRYGQFRDGVVSSEAEDGKIRIVVESPDVEFATARGEARVTVNCSRAEFDLTDEQFERLISAGSLTLTKEIGGSRSAGCVAGSTITLELVTKLR